MSAPPDRYADGWHQILTAAGLADFEALWTCAGEVVDEPNRKGDDWSQVVRVDTGAHRLYVKRHDNWLIRNDFLPWDTPACLAEARNLDRATRAGFVVPTPAYVGVRPADGRTRGVIVLPELTGYASLPERLGQWYHDAARRHRLATALGAFLRRFHAAGFRHGSLYPKHVMVGSAPDDLALIDLEHSRRWPLGVGPGRFRDLHTLDRHTVWASHTDRLRVLRSYLDRARLDRRARRLATRLAVRRQRRPTPESHDLVIGGR